MLKDSIFTSQVAVNIRGWEILFAYLNHNFWGFIYNRQVSSEREHEGALSSDRRDGVGNGYGCPC